MTLDFDFFLTCVTSMDFCMSYRVHMSPETLDQMSFTPTRETSYSDEGFGGAM